MGVKPLSKHYDKKNMGINMKNNNLLQQNRNFCHLHGHSEMSLLDGFGSAASYITKAKELGFSYIACTDHASIDNLIAWQKECNHAGIQPVLGSELYIVPDRHIKQKGEKRGHITIWVKNEVGWENLCSMMTESNLTGFYYRPRIDYSLLMSHDLSGLIIGTACAGSFLNDPACDKDFIKSLSQKTDLYWEIMPHKIKCQKDLHKKIKKLSKDFPEIPFLATNDFHYVLKEDWEAQEMLLAIQSRAKWNDPNRWTFGFKGLHLRTADEMIDAFKKQGDFDTNIVKEAMSNTVKIAKQCECFRIKKQEMSLPLPPGTKEEDEEKKFIELCKEGYKKIFGTEQWSQEHRDRCNLEMKLIRKKGFIRYFLIVHDLVSWCQEHDITVGPGRGSAAGSLISFLLGVTSVNPLIFNLSFDRFLNEERKSLPDIDLDFPKIKRGEVVQYLADTYGENNTPGISTSMKMQSKGAVRDVCRVMEIPSKDAGIFAGSIWNSNDGSSAIQNSVDKTREGKYFAKRYPKALALALKMEGQVRGAGAHAAGVIVSNEDLTKSNKCVLVKRNKRIVCNWSKKDAEYCGLMKLDVLGLSTLSVLSHAKKLINQKENQKQFYYRPESKQNLFLNVMTRELEKRYKNCEQIDFDYFKVSLKDKKTFDMLSNGETSGIFQMAGRACTELCVRMGVHSFNDICAISALARPGPADSGITDEYVERKHGKKWTPRHPIYEKITKSTHGLIVYQEQIMSVISEMAGLGASVADSIRKIITKKRSLEEFKPYWEQFRGGCKKTGTMSDGEAEAFWEELQAHASYSFNLSHSVSYSHISYWTAYIKTHCEKEFYAGSLTYGEGDVEPLLAEIKNKGYEVISPKRKYSEASVWKFVDNKLYVPFTEIIGIGENNAKKLLSAKPKSVNKGFFGEDISLTKRTKLEQILFELDVDKDTVPHDKILKKYIPTIV